MRYLLALAALLMAFAGCASFWPDVKAAADVCRPELAPDVEAVMPYVLVLVGCEIAHGDCTATLNDIAALGKADATQCALAEAHAVVVKLAGADAGAP